MWERLTDVNQRMNDLPRRLFIILAMLLMLGLLAFLAQYIGPFLVALILTWLIEPLVKILTRMFGRLRAARVISAAFSTILLLAITLTLLLLLSTRVFTEIRALASTMPARVSLWVMEMTNWVSTRMPEWELLTDTARQTIQDTIISMGRSITSSASSFASVLARGVWNTATVTLPQGILFVTLTFLGTFYFSSDRVRIISFVKGLMPPSWVQGGALVKANIFKALLIQFRAQMVMMLVTFTELSIGFSLIGMDYVLLLALGISILDALPVLGTGLFLIPFAITGFVTRNLRMGVGMLVLYLIVGIVRQTLEPRLLGRNLGLHPLATMMAMYASFRVMGFIGMLLGPIILLLCKAVLAFYSPAPCAVPVVQPTPTKPLAVRVEARLKRKRR